MFTNGSNIYMNHILPIKYLNEPYLTYQIYIWTISYLSNNYTLWEKWYSTKESFSTDLIQIFGYSEPSSGNNGRQITRHRIGIEKYILLDLNEIKWSNILKKLNPKHRFVYKWVNSQLLCFPLHSKFCCWIKPHSCYSDQQTESPNCTSTCLLFSLGF